MVKIIIEPQGCRIEDEKDIGILWALDKELSYAVQGAQFTRAYSGYHYQGKFISWDGRQKLFDNKTLCFQYGLKQRVIEFYRKQNIEPEIIDNRPPKSVGQPIDIAAKLVELNKVPRPFQIDTVKAAIDNDVGIIRLPTGSGKSLCAALIVAAIGKKSIVYVIGKDLLYQFYDFFKTIFDNVGIVGDGKCDISDINIVSVWTAGKALGLKESDILIESEEESEKDVGAEKYNDIKKLLMEAKLQICDECHYCSCESITTIAKNIVPEHLYGMSASPWRDDGTDILIEAFLGHKIIDISASTLIEQGYLVQPFIKFIPVPKYPEKLKKNYQTIYKHYIVENEVRNKLVIEATKDMVNKGYKPLILFNSIKHGEILYEMLKKEMSCSLISGKDKMEVRNKSREDITNGNIKAILASKVYDCGIDCPILSALIVASPGKSSVRALQRIGRVIRLFPGKKVAAIADFVDDAAYLKQHSLARKKIYESEKGFIVKWPKKLL